MRVARDALNSVAYLYPSEEAATRGEQAGATGFFVYVATPDHDKLTFTHTHLVTNEHVAFREGLPPTFVRVNRTSPLPPLVFPLGARQWHRHPEGDDIAVCYLGTTSPLTGESHILSNNLFVTEQHIANGHVGLGDDCLMVGRFALHPGKLRNTPVVRFGNISMLPEERIWIEARNRFQIGFLVEMRSRMGFSGSPVFLLPQLGMTGEERDQTLGISMGAFSDEATIRLPRLDLTGRIDEHSGMAIVIPAWRIQEILDLEELVVARKNEESARRMTRG